MSNITTHILDASRGRPASAVTVILKQARHDNYIVLDEKQTDADGRIKDFAVTPITEGDYQLEFLIRDYFEHNGSECFYPKVCIDFTVRDAAQHFHVPLLISPFSYSTYRGS